MPMIRGATKRVRDDARVVDGCVVGDVVARARHVAMGGVKIDASIARGARSGATTRGWRGRARANGSIDGARELSKSFLNMTCD